MLDMQANAQRGATKNAGTSWTSFEEALDIYLTVLSPAVRQAVAAWFPSSGSEWFDVHARREMPTKRDFHLSAAANMLAS